MKPFKLNTLFILIRTVEIITCIFIIAGVVRHW
jgi:hypothetical protein